MTKLLRNMLLQVLVLGFVLTMFVLQSKLKFTQKFLTMDSNHFRKYVETQPLSNKSVKTSFVPFKLELNFTIEPNISLSSPNLLVLNLVTSSVPNFKKRNVIRETWANQKHFPNTRSKTVFLLGGTKNKTYQKLIEKEAAIYGDILQTWYMDTYRNLTYKITSSFTWAMQHGQNISWFAKIDDDMLVNPFQMKTFLEITLAANKGEPTNSIYGRLRRLAKPFRNGKYIVTMKEYPYKIYPPHILGSAYILGQKALFNIVKNMENSQFLYLEDVFLTGLVGKKAQVSLNNLEQTKFTTKINVMFTRGSKFFCVGCNLGSAKSTWEKIIYSFKIRGT